MTDAQLCRHFGVCGGCLYQNLPADTYRALKRNLVVDALAKHGLGDVRVEEAIDCGPGTRRRASLKVAKHAGSTHIGFHAASSHDIVDMRECLVLTPALFTLVQGLREMVQALLRDGEKAELFAVETMNGPDVAVRWNRALTPAIVSTAALYAKRLGLARLTMNGEPAFEDGAPCVEFSGVRVDLPVESFLQPTLAGEALLQAKVSEAAKDSKVVADLFAGCGTFTFTLAKLARVHAVDADRTAIDRLAAAARGGSRLKPITTEVRNLFKHPLAAAELARFDLVVLDPPRLGALAQVHEIAKSKLTRVAYVSCNAVSLARDSKVLVDGGFGMGTVWPMDQFLWSSHIEVMTVFARA